jgi:hypothetical protein
MWNSSDLDCLDELALRAGADIRAALLRNLVDLYLQRPTHTAEEAQHFTELSIRLLDQVEVDTRIATARRLVAYPSVPAAIMRWLADDVPEVAALVRPASRGAATTQEKAAPAHERASAAELSELFFAASAAERRLILINLRYAPAPAAAATGNNAREAARQLETAALARNPDAFMRALERWLGIAPTLSRRIVRDPLGEPIVVAAKVLGLASDALQRILLFLNPVVGRSVYRVYELAMLFESIDSAAAHALADIWRTAEPRSATRPAQSEGADPGVRRTAASQTMTQRDSANAPARLAGKR